MSRTLQFKRYPASVVANTTGANGELIIDTTNFSLTIHDGTTLGGHSVSAQSSDGTARTIANAAFIQANSAFLKANTPDAIANSAAAYANAAFAQANAAFSVANTGITDDFARTTANAAFTAANTKFSSSGGTISGSITTTGNTTVSQTLQANTVIVDYILYSGLAARSSAPLSNLIAQFASNSSTYVQVNQQNINPLGSADYVVTADNGTDTDFYIDMGLHGSQATDRIVNPYDGYLFVQGSTIGQAGGNLIIGTTSSYGGLETKFVAGGYNANNTVMKLGTYGANVVGSLTVTGAIIGSTINAISTNVTSSSTYANGAFLQANAAFLQANTPQATANSAATYANGAFLQANAAFLKANTPDAIANSASTYANGAFTQANAAFLTANTPTHVANSAATYANGAFVQANAAFLVANTPTHVANSAALYANGAFTQANTAANTLPQNPQTTNYVLQLTDAGKHIYYTQAANVNLYIPNAGQTVFANGHTITIISRTTSSANVTVTPNTGVSMYLAGNTTSSSRNVTTYGMATLIQVAANTWFINGTGVS